jgi:glycine/sarcosine N-methyltransferase
MGRMTEGGGPSGAGGPAALREVKRFYDALAPDYDLMTAFDDRFAKERPWFEAIVSKFGIRSALDAGCGTGFHSILLSRLGVAVWGVDASPAMIERARENARRLGSAVTLHTGRFDEISGVPSGSIGPCDAVFCLGNSLPHLLTDDDLTAALSEFRSVLRPGGVLVLQLLNYEKLLSERKEVLGKREAGGTTFERRYAYRGETVTFTLLRGAESESVTLRPLTRELLGNALARAGMEKVEVFGNLAMGAFDPAVSSDLVTVAFRPAA